MAGSGIIYLKLVTSISSISIHFLSSFFYISFSVLIVAEGPLSFATEAKWKRDGSA